jgi:predicted membrane channel-forming protein YqfA (hemolysin III family)
MNLSESEEKFLLRFGKNIKRIYIAHISVGVSLCTAMVGLIIGIVLGRKEAFLITILFGGISINLFLMSRTYQKLFSIISKLKQTVKDLEDIVAKTNLHNEKRGSE